jgi:hypothetical protein
MGESEASERRRDLADHFLECAKVGRYLTLADESRFVITDDFREGVKVEPVVAAAATVFSKDVLVGQAALVPLGLTADRGSWRERRKFEELFSLIERQAFGPEVRQSAHALLEASFREARVRELEAELGSRISPARRRYRAFLEVVRQLMEKKISPPAFRDEFLAFTHAVAGKLDFGIYSFCLDRIFGNPLIPLQAKAYLIAEVVGFPPLIRRELIANVLSASAQRRDLVDLTRKIIERELPNEVVIEIYLLVTLKSSRLSVKQVQDIFTGGVESKIAARPGLAFP